MARSGEGHRGRSVLSKVIAVLEAFSPATPQLSLNDLARRTGLPVSTAYRVASELVEWGGLERVNGGGYRIGLRLWEIGSLAPRGETVRDIALPFMNDLHQATRENVHLAVLHGRDALYIEKITGRRSVRVKSRRGGRLPLHATGVGKVLLAYAPPEFVDEVLRGELRRYTAHTIITPGRLHQVLTEVRRTGIAFTREEMTLGSLSVAAPVLDASGRAVAALAVVLRVGHMDPRRVAPAVQTAANSVSREVRHRAVQAPDRVSGDGTGTDGS